MKRPTQEQIDAFEADLDAVCEKHGFDLAHEDGHGAFLIRKPLAEPCFYGSLVVDRRSNWD